MLFSVHIFIFFSYTNLFLLCHLNRDNLNYSKFNFHFHIYIFLHLMYMKFYENYRDSLLWVLGIPDHCWTVLILQPSPASQISYWMQMFPQMNLVQLVAKYVKARTKIESDGLILKIGPLLRICWTAEHCEVRANREKWRRFRTGKYQVHDNLGLVNILDHGRFTRTHSLCMRI